MKVEILDNKIVFGGYPFPSLGKKKRIVFANEIDFIELENDPIFLSVNSKEILFIPRKYYDLIKQFIERNKIKISDKIDAWELICYPFADTQRTSEEMKENAFQLKNLSFEENEVEIIRKRIDRLLSWYVMFSMEYSALNHYDLLTARKNIYFFNPFWKRFYWYTMEIALRGYGLSAKK